MNDDLQDAIGIIRGLLEWAPDDLGEMEPDIWREAREFLKEKTA